MEINFSSDIIKLTFTDDGVFAGRSLRMEGEALSKGFDADADSMEWLGDFRDEPISNTAKNQIKQLIQLRNETHDFKIIFMGDDDV